MGRITPSPRTLYEETVEELKSQYRSSLVDQGHRQAFDLLLKQAWETEQAAMANSNIPVVIDRLNLTSNLHNRKLVEALSKRVEEMEEAIVALEKEILELKAQLQTSTKKEDEEGGV
jgi:uncharacterized small protein (DUF1192 family)